MYHRRLAIGLTVIQRVNVSGVTNGSPVILNEQYAKGVRPMNEIVNQTVIVYPESGEPYTAAVTWSDGDSLRVTPLDGDPLVSLEVPRADVVPLPPFEPVEMISSWELIFNRNTEHPGFYYVEDWKGVDTDEIFQYCDDHVNEIDELTSVYGLRWMGGTLPTDLLGYKVYLPTASKRLDIYRKLGAMGMVTYSDDKYLYVALMGDDSLDPVKVEISDVVILPNDR